MYVEISQTLYDVPGPAGRNRASWPREPVPAADPHAATERAGWMRQRPRPPPQPGVAFEDAPHQRLHRAVALPTQAVGGHLQTGPAHGRRRRAERAHDGPAAVQPSLIGAEFSPCRRQPCRSAVSRNPLAEPTLPSATAWRPNSLPAPGRQIPTGGRARRSPEAPGRMHAQEKRSRLPMSSASGLQTALPLPT